MTATITIISFRKRLVDVDNISAKALIDGLVNAGVLEDDSPKHVDEVRLKQLQSDDERTIVQIRFNEED
jgi:Holliday junction resolvase RusA-like endonuclease